MNERDAFIQAIIADPADDLPRLVLADWLDENDEPERAEFIRLQCKIATLPEKITTGNKCHGCGKSGRWRRGVGFEHEKICHPCDIVWEPGEEIDNPARVALQKREHELLEWFCTNDEAYYFGLTPHESMYPIDTGFTVPGLLDLQLRRGFIAFVRCPLGVWMEHGPRLVREHPIERVIATDLHPVEVGDTRATLNPNRFTFFLGDSFVGPAKYCTHPIAMRLKNRLFYNIESAIDALSDALSDALIAWAKSQQPVEVTT